MILKDGHVHTPYCPHGTNDQLEEYIEKALNLGIKEISFTEHAPLPEGFTDTTPEKDSGMKMEELPAYFEEILRLKQIYERHIRINAGLEVDYVEGFEGETKAFLNRIGHQLDDAILSVHFLKTGNDYSCIDYSPDVFKETADRIGGIDSLYSLYYKTVHASIMADLGAFKPKRIGHITLCHKFQKKHPAQSDFSKEITSLLNSMKKNGYELDYNGAGTAKPLCREPYPPLWVAKEALRMNIPLIYGSDAHQAKELGQGYTETILCL